MGPGTPRGRLVTITEDGLSADGLSVSFGCVVMRCDPRGTHYHVTVRGIGRPGQRPLLGTLIMSPEEWHHIVAAALVVEAHS
jgi:hypothetical protein